MIDRIGNSYDYQPQQLNKRIKNNTETFSMEYGQQEKPVLDTEDNEKKEESAIEALLKKQQESDGGVSVELSQVQKQSVDGMNTVEETRMQGNLLERLKNLWSDVKAAFVKFFTGVEVERVSQDEIIVEETQEEPVQDIPQTQEQARQQLLESLYEKGEKKLAHNSDLLTTYDKRGSFVQINAGDKNRILHAHPNQIDETF